MIMDENQPSPLVPIFYKDDNDQVITEKTFPLEANLGQIVELQKDTQWVEIPFDDIELLVRLEVFKYRDDDEVYINYVFDIDALINHAVTDPDEAERAWQETAESLEEELWEREQRIRTLFGCEELLILWGGPSDTPQPKGELDVNFYIDDSWSFLTVTRRWTVAGFDRSLTLDTLRTRAEVLDGLVKEVIQSVLEP
jgi:hypothetical protein